MIRNFLLFTIFLMGGILLSPANYAQSSLDHQWYINASGGITQMYGDISSSNNPIDKLENETEIGYGLRFGKYISPVFSGHLQVINNKFKGYDEPANLEFNSDIIEMQLGTTVNISNLFFSNRSRRVSFYGLLGISGLSFRSKSFDTETGVYSGLYGYSDEEPPAKTSREFDLAFPLGGGIDLKLSNHWYLNLETAIRLSLTDKLDGLEAGSNKDTYYYTSLGISYNFNLSSKKEPVTPADEPEIVQEPEDPYADTYIDLLYYFPEEIRSMDEFTLRCKIYKGAIQGRGELIQVLPIGFNVLDTAISNARVEFKDYTLSLYWDELPKDSIFEVSYQVQLDKIYGTLPMNSILYLNETGKEYRFKTDVFIKRRIIAEPVVVKEEKPNEDEMSSPSDRVDFRIQIRASYRKRLSVDSLGRTFNLDREIKEEYVDGWYKYSVGSFKTYEEARAFRKEMVKKQFLKDAFIIGYFDNERLNALSELKDIAPEVLPGGKPKPKISKYQENGICYRVQIFALRHKRVSPSALKDLYQIEKEINEETYYNWRKYTVGDCLNVKDALQTRKDLINKGLEGSFVVKYRNGIRSSIK